MAKPRTSAASEPRERSAPAKRRARARAGESEGRSPSDKTDETRMPAMPLDRRHEITRLEAFSDAVFAFALTLLVVSLEVPHSYRELMNLVRGFVPFAACF